MIDDIKTRLHIKQRKEYQQGAAYLIMPGHPDIDPVYVYCIENSNEKRYCDYD
jgi:hypothetical protein